MDFGYAQLRSAMMFERMGYCYVGIMGSRLVGGDSSLCYNGALKLS